MIEEDEVHHGEDEQELEQGSGDVDGGATVLNLAVEDATDLQACVYETSNTKHCKG